MNPHHIKKYIRCPVEIGWYEITIKDMHKSITRYNILSLDMEDEIYEEYTKSNK